MNTSLSRKSIILTAYLSNNFIKKYDGQNNNFEGHTQMTDMKQKLLNKLPMQGGNVTAEAFQVRELFK